MYNLDSGEVGHMDFLRLNHINDYNNTIGRVDIAYKLRDMYQHDNWIRKRRWWWAIWNWSLGLQLINAYIKYVNLNVQDGKRKIYLLSHHDLRKSIALSWINPEAVHYSKILSLSRNRGWDTADASVAPTITMDKMNSSKTRYTEVNADYVTSTKKLSSIILYTPLYDYLDILKNSYYIPH